MGEKAGARAPPPQRSEACAMDALLATALIPAALLALLIVATWKGLD